MIRARHLAQDRSRPSRWVALALSLALGASAIAAEPFAGQRELLQRQLGIAAPGHNAATASALVAARLGGAGGEPELLLLGTRPGPARR